MNLILLAAGVGILYYLAQAREAIAATQTTPTTGTTPNQVPAIIAGNSGNGSYQLPIVGGGRGDLYDPAPRDIYGGGYSFNPGAYADDFTNWVNSIPVGYQEPQGRPEGGWTVDAGGGGGTTTGDAAARMTDQQVIEISALIGLF